MNFLKRNWYWFAFGLLFYWTYRRALEKLGDSRPIPLPENSKVLSPNGGLAVVEPMKITAEELIERTRYA